MTPQEAFEEMELLLPFYVNGTLSAADRQRVDAGLEVSPSLRASLAEHRGVASRIQDGSASMLAGGRGQEHLLQDVLAKIDALPKPSALKASAPTSSLKMLLQALSPSRWHPAVSLAMAVAIVAQGAVLVGWYNQRQSQDVAVADLTKRVKDLEFQLASGPDTPATLGSIIMQVDEGANWGALEALLTSENLSVTDGPRDGTLTLSSELKDQALADLIERLRMSPLVISVDKAA
jgi:hypothetical protein